MASNPTLALALCTPQCTTRVQQNAPEADMSLEIGEADHAPGPANQQEDNSCYHSRPTDISNSSPKALTNNFGVQRKGIARPTRKPVHGACRVRKRVSPTIKSKRTRLKAWRFQNGTSGIDEVHGIEICFERPSKSGNTVASWMAEEDAHREFASELLKFWEGQGGRENAIVKKGGVIDENTMYIMLNILDCRLSGPTMKYLIRWVGYSDDKCTWEPESKICAELLERFWRKGYVT